MWTSPRREVKEPSVQVSIVSMQISEGPAGIEMSGGWKRKEAYGFRGGSC